MTMRVILSQINLHRAKCSFNRTPLPTTSHIYLPASIRAALPCCASSPSSSYTSSTSLDLAATTSLLSDTPLAAAAADDDSNSGSLDSDTIVAVVTGAQQGSVSIIRLSGWEAVATATAVFRPASSSSSSTTSSPSPKRDWSPESHRVYYGHATDADHHIIDEVLVLVMLAPRSFTAEDVVEIHTHGGGVCAQRVVQACLSAGARLARPGEFTLRAFLNGRLDLSQAESVAELVDARTVAAADSALAGLAGGLGREIQRVRGECLDLLVEMDARIDFDEDLPPLNVETVVERIRAVAESIAAALSTARQGQLLRTGLQVALVGRPNVGKSSLLNTLSGTQRAIVTEIAGTTRDVVDVGLVVGGIPLTLLDTAGLRDAEDKVERIGVERSVAAARGADVVVMVADGGVGWTSDDEEIFELLALSTFDIDGGGDGDGYDDDNEVVAGKRCVVSKMPPALLVINKVDLTEQKNNNVAAAALPRFVQKSFSHVLYTSATTGEGLDELKAALLEVAGAPQLAPGGVSWSVNERQGEALTRASEALTRVESSIVGDLPIDFWTIDLRAAVMALGEVSGEEITEEVLDAVFSRFCIGK